MLSLLWSLSAAPQTVNNSARAAFIDKMVRQHGFDRAELTALLDEAVIDKTILETMARPADGIAAEDLATTAEALVREVAGRAPLPVRHVKELVDRAVAEPLDHVMAGEREAQAVIPPAGATAASGS